MNCVICSEPIKPLLDPTTGVVVWEHGNNAEPIKEGRCCDDCNREKVIPRRFEDALGPAQTKAAHELADVVNKAEAEWRAEQQERYDREWASLPDDPMETER